MLRRKLSSGLLRAASAAQAPSQATATTSLALSHGAHRAATASPSSSPAVLIQSANLVSAVLLSSQRNWRDETVASLKGELKRRGLSQTGNKATLVSRLSSAEASAHLPPVPPLPSSSSSTVQKTQTRSRRSLSSTAVKREPQAAKSDTTAANANANASSVTSAGPDVVSQRTEAPKKQEVKPEEITVAPGLPETAKPVKEVNEAARGMTPSIPMADLVEKGEEQVIPLVPDNFRSQQHLPSSDSKSSTSEPSLPKISTVVSGATMPGGGPSHALHDYAASLASSAEDQIQKIDLPGLGEYLGNIASSPVRGVKALTGGLGGLSIGSPKAGESGEYKVNSKPLDGEEKTGAYILGGIVVAGLLLGGGASKKDGKAEKLKNKVKGAVGAGGVQGDENWAKASGAGVVGHGARKA